MFKESPSWKEKMSFLGQKQKELLKELKDTEKFPISYLNDPDPSTRALGAHAYNVFYLKSSKEYEHIEEIYPLLKDSDPIVRKYAIDAVFIKGFIFLQNPESLLPLVTQCMEDSDVVVRQHVLRSLKHIPKEQILRKKFIPVLERGLIHKDEETRYSAIETFYEFIDSYDDLNARIKILLKDQSKDVRLATASLLSYTLSSIIGSKKVLEEFHEYSIKEFPEIHFCLTGMGYSNIEFIKENKIFKQYLVNVALEANDWITVDFLLWVCAKRMNGNDPILKEIIYSALENDNLKIRNLGKYYYNLLTEWHSR